MFKDELEAQQRRTELGEITERHTRTVENIRLITMLLGYFLLLAYIATGIGALCALAMFVLLPPTVLCIGDVAARRWP